MDSDNNTSSPATFPPIDAYCADRRARTTTLMPYIYTFIVLRVLLSVCALVANFKLLIYAQWKASKLWFEHDRPFIFGILAWNLIGSLAIILNGTLRLIITFTARISPATSMSLNKYMFPIFVILADASVTTLVLYIWIISIRGILFIQKYKGGVEQGDQRILRNKPFSIALSMFVGVFAFVTSFCGLNTHDQAMFNATSMSSAVCFFVACLIVQISTAVILYKTKKLVGEIQHDFVVNQAQQHLESRVSLNRVVANIRALRPLSTLNVTVWFAIWVTDFVFDRVIDSSPALSACGSNPPEYYIWSSIMDISAVLYGLMYPHILTRRSGDTFTKKCMKLFSCRYELSSAETSVITPLGGDERVGGVNSGSRAMGPVKHGGHHWAAMNAQWSTVEKSKLTIPKSGSDANVIGSGAGGAGNRNGESNDRHA